MKIKLSLAILLSFLLGSCSTNRLTRFVTGEITPKKNPLEESTALTPEKLEEQGQNIHMVRGAHATETKEGQVVGSASIEHREANKKHVYFLYGAEHLDLKNYYFDIPVVYNQKVRRWIDYFLNRGRKHFIRYSKRAGRYAPVLGKILEDHGLPRDLIFLAMAESGFHNKAKSWAKAVGPWQFMPFTGRKYGLKINWYLDERRDPLKATVAASKYLSDLHELFGSWELAISGYNAGEGKISRAIRRYGTRNFWKLSKGRYLKRETKNYVPKIMALAIIGKNLESFGFDEIEFEHPLDFDEIDIPGNTDLYQIADAINVRFEMLKKLNPEIMRWITPPDMSTYTLRVPVGKKLAFEQCCSSLNLAAKDFEEYTVKSRRGVSLKKLAGKFRLKYANVLEDLNGLQSKKILRKGDKVLLPFHRDHGRKGAMYADLYEKPRRSVRRAKNYRRRIRLAQRRGRRITNPKGFYVVKKGDTLWSIARKTGVSLDTLIASNLKIVRGRMIRRGDRLAIR